LKPNLRLPKLAIQTSEKTEKKKEEFNLENYKDDALSKARPISVPIWLEDNKLTKGTESDKSSISMKAKRETPIPLIHENSTIRTKREETSTNFTDSTSINEQPKVSRRRNGPRIGSIFEEIEAAKKMETADTFLTKQENPPQIFPPKMKDDNLSINSVEYFNITNFGRLKPAKRDSMKEIIDLKEDVIERVKKVEKLLDFKSENSGEVRAPSRIEYQSGMPQ
jgi:hypothetical protein